MKGNFFSWFRSVAPAAVVTSDRTRIRELLERQGFACINIKSKGDPTSTDTVFVLELHSHSISGHGSKAMTTPDIGRQVWQLAHIDIVNVIEPGMIPVMNDTRYGSLKSWVERLSSELQYDERYCIYQARSGERVYINGGFNINKDGFTGVRAYVTELRPNGTCGAFVTYCLAPFYNGEFFRSGEVEPIPDFIYYSWMGSRVRNKEYLKPMQVEARSSAIVSLESMLEAQRVQTRNMEIILSQLKQAQLDVHE